mmetsp:Transcript_7907/g.11135  ORF Transcript_7907/g.11135 Transcript_7907/m.11135 type:complete len:92 (+) Transcript_7907:185-460(+)
MCPRDDTGLKSRVTIFFWILDFMAEGDSDVRILDRSDIVFSFLLVVVEDASANGGKNDSITLNNTTRLRPAEVGVMNNSTCVAPLPGMFRL